MDTTLLILAAGIGRRFGGPKQLAPLGPTGETIIDYSVYDAILAGFTKVVFVIRTEIEAEFKARFSHGFNDRIEVESVLQEMASVPEGVSVPKSRNKPWGTGHAVLAAQALIAEPFAVINADDFYGRRAFELVHAHLTTADLDQNREYALVGYPVANTLSDHGPVSRGLCKIDDAGYLESIKELKNISRTNDTIVNRDEEGKTVLLPHNAIVSMNFMAFGVSIFSHLEKLFIEFCRKNDSPEDAEFYLPSAVNRLISERHARMKVLTTGDKWFGMTYDRDRVDVSEHIARLIERGFYPAKLWQV